jgi:L-lactate dehydrogenase complex protein LldF
MSHSSNHAQRVEIFIRNEERVDWHSKALLNLRDKRDLQTQSVSQWEQMRETASQMKLNVLSHLPTYLAQFADNCEQNGMTVHWAKDDKEHNEIVARILQDRKKTKLIKSKSMLTEECKLVPHLESLGIECIESDLGERILQLNGERPSHIVVPAIHLKKEEVGELFHEKLGSEKGASDPTYLTHAARASLRNDFLTADAAMTGVNMAIAEDGAFVVCTNEGNADMGAHLTDLHIAVMGVDKIVPNADAAALLMRMLARSAIGQPSTSYNSVFGGPREGCEIHIVIVDNGRSKRLQDAKHAEVYKCIRCGACMNTCPVYRRSGGHSYEYFIPGPIGLAINANDESSGSDAWACTMCGSCSNVCPVKVPLHKTIMYHREQIATRGDLPYAKPWYMPATAAILKNSLRLNSAMTITKIGMRILPKPMQKIMAGGWGRSREMPRIPDQSFESWYAKNRGKK